MKLHPNGISPHGISILVAWADVCAEPDQVWRGRPRPRKASDICTIVLVDTCSEFP